MRTLRLTAIIGFIAAIAIIAIIAIITSALFDTAWDESTTRSDSPLTKADATTAGVSVPLPASAHSIYYLFHAGGMQDLESYTRFDVAPSELDSAADALVAWNNKMMSRTLAYPKSPLTTAPQPTPREQFLPITWWDPSTITSGYSRFENVSHALTIFVDQARSRIYVYQND